MWEHKFKLCKHVCRHEFKRGVNHFVNQCLIIFVNLSLSLCVSIFVWVNNGVRNVRKQWDKHVHKYILTWECKHRVHKALTVLVLVFLAKLCWNKYLVLINKMRADIWMLLAYGYSVNISMEIENVWNKFYE